MSGCVRLDDDAAISGHGLVTPSRAELACAGRVIGWLSAMIVRVPVFPLKWFRPAHPIDEEMLHGLAGRTFASRTPAIVLILSGLPEDELVRVVAHEVKHVLDAPQARAGTLTEAQLEARADGFAAMWKPSLLKALGVAPPKPPRGPSAPESLVSRLAPTQIWGRYR